MGRWGNLLAVALLACLLELPAWGHSVEQAYRTLRASLDVRRDLSLERIRQTGSRYAGRVVEWRGMVDDLAFDGKGLHFVLKIGPDRADVRVAGASFQMQGGAAVGVMARVLDGGPHPVLQLVAAAPAYLVGLGGDPVPVFPSHFGAGSPYWCQWVQSFNRSLSRETAAAYVAAISRFAKDNGVDPRLVLSVVAAESSFQADAVSPVGAVGLGQLMPETAQMLGVRDPRDPMQNLEGSARLLGSHLRRWQRSPDVLSRVLASYNAGVGAVETYGGIPPYAETQNYVQYVLSLYRELGGR